VCTTLLSYPDISEKIPEDMNEKPKENEGVLKSVAKGIFGWFGGK